MGIWVTAEFYHQKRGVKPSTLRGWVDRGLLDIGTHYTMIGHKRLYDIKAIDQWLSLKASEQRAAPSKSDGATRASRTKKPSLKDQLRQRNDGRLSTVTAALN